MIPGATVTLLLEIDARDAYVLDSLQQIGRLSWRGPCFLLYFLHRCARVPTENDALLARRAFAEHAIHSRRGFYKKKAKGKTRKTGKKGDKEFVKRKRRGYGRRAEKEDVTWGSIFPCALGSGGRPNDIRVRKSPETQVGEEEKN